MNRLKLPYLLPLCLAACAVADSKRAQQAQTQLIGMTEVDLESCIGAPDQHARFGTTDVLTYYAVSTSSTSLAVPAVGGIGLNYGGYCHATFQVRNGIVTQILYSGEKNALLAPNSYCAPIVSTCLGHLEAVRSAAAPAAAPASGGAGSPPATASPAGPSSAMPAQNTPPGMARPTAAP